TTTNGISYISAVNVQQLKCEDGHLFFCISAISNCQEVGLISDSAYTSIIEIDASNGKKKIVNIRYKPNQLVNLFQLSDRDFDNKEVIEKKTVFKGFDYFKDGVYLHKELTLRGKILSNKKYLLFFKR